MENIGIAKNTAASQQFLNSCEAVVRWAQHDADAEYLWFNYDPETEVPYVPAGIYFDPDTCTEDQRWIGCGMSSL